MVHKSAEWVGSYSALRCANSCPCGQLLVAWVALLMLTGSITGQGLWLE